MAAPYESSDAAGAPAPSAWEQSLQQSVQHVFAAQQAQQAGHQAPQAPHAPHALQYDGRGAQPAQPSAGTQHAPPPSATPRDWNVAMDVATGMAAGHARGVQAVQDRVDADAGGFAVTLSPRTHSLLTNPIASYAVSITVLALVLFVCLLVSSPGFVQERVEHKDGSVRYALSMKRAAVFAALFAVCIVAAPAVYKRLRPSKSTP